MVLLIYIVLNDTTIPSDIAPFYLLIPCVHEKGLYKYFNMRSCSKRECEQSCYYNNPVTLADSKSAIQ